MYRVTTANSMAIVQPVLGFDDLFLAARKTDGARETARESPSFLNRRSQVRLLSGAAEKSSPQIEWSPPSSNPGREVPQIDRGFALIRHLLKQTHELI